MDGRKKRVGGLREGVKGVRSEAERWMDGMGDAPKRAIYMFCSYCTIHQCLL